jgi:hypothetical protein
MERKGPGRRTALSSTRERRHGRQFHLARGSGSGPYLSAESIRPRRTALQLVGEALDSSNRFSDWDSLSALSAAEVWHGSKHVLHFSFFTSGLRSRTGVPGQASRPRTRTTLSTISRTSTLVTPIGLGRRGLRRSKTPRRAL